MKLHSVVVIYINIEILFLPVEGTVVTGASVGDVMLTGGEVALAVEEVALSGGDVMLSGGEVAFSGGDIYKYGNSFFTC